MKPPTNELESDDSSSSGSTAGRCFGVIPAAGKSRRMGQPKLLLPWPSPDHPTRCVIESVLGACVDSQLTRTCVILNRDRSSELRGKLDPFELDVVLADAPVDMKASIVAGIDWIESRYDPTAEDWLMFTPADMPRLSTTTIDRLLAARREDNSSIVPIYGNQTGHPVLLRWAKVSEIRRLPLQKGLNAIVDSIPRTEVKFSSDDYFADMDTPEDYRRELARIAKQDPNSPN